MLKRKKKSSSNDWVRILKYDPMPALISTDNQAVAFFAARDLLGKVEPTETLWRLPEAMRIVRRQQTDGSWKYPGGNKSIRSAENYNQIETYRNLGYLVEMFGCNKKNSVVEKAAEYFFRFQTADGDIRGILGNQYTPYYTAGIIELLLKAGYLDDDRIEKVFQWLRRIRQDDGGWAIPLRTQGRNLDAIFTEKKTLEPVRSMPFSHLVTGVVLRAYVAHPRYAASAEAQAAGKLLLKSFFTKDSYPDRANPDFWLRFTYPFWFTDLLSAMDTLTRLGFSKSDPEIKRAIEWLVSNQQPDGLWKLKILKNKASYDTDLWLSLTTCRILKRVY